MSNSKIRIRSLVHELRERIAASSSANASTDSGGYGPLGDDDAVEARFRAVLSNLLHAYPMREKLYSHTEAYLPSARSLPGVYYHGKAIAVLPIIGRILPFFAEPTFSAWYGINFEAATSLLSLLRMGDRDAYRQFFVDNSGIRGLLSDHNGTCKGGFQNNMGHATSVMADLHAIKEGIQLAMKLLFLDMEIEADAQTLSLKPFIAD